MLIDVLLRLAAETGLHETQKRTTLIKYLNQSAKEMHKMLECNKIFREVTLVVQPNSVVTLPAFIGELRGMRMHTNELPFDLNAIAQPRYISTTLAHKFKNWRDLGESAIKVSMTSASQLNLHTDTIEDNPTDILVVGPTTSSNYTEELVTMDANDKTTSNVFLDIQSISCAANRLYNVTISQTSDNTPLGILYNNFRKTRYKLVDVSLIFWTIDSNDGGSLIDVLYKLPATELVNDSDSFYAGEDYDEPWFNLSMYQYLRPIQNRQQDAQAFFGAFLQQMQASKDSSETGIMKKLQFGRNRFYGLFRKYRYYPGSVTNVDNNVQT